MAVKQFKEKFTPTVEYGGLINTNGTSSTQKFDYNGILLGKKGTSTGRGYLSFDISKIGKNAAIGKATLFFGSGDPSNNNSFDGNFKIANLQQTPDKTFTWSDLAISGNGTRLNLSVPGATNDYMFPFNSALEKSLQECIKKGEKKFGLVLNHISETQKNLNLNNFNTYLYLEYKAEDGTGGTGNTGKKREYIIESVDLDETSRIFTLKASSDLTQYDLLYDKSKFNILSITENIIKFSIKENSSKLETFRIERKVNNYTYFDLIHLPLLPDYFIHTGKPGSLEFNIPEMLRAKTNWNIEEWVLPLGYNLATYFGSMALFTTTTTVNPFFIQAILGSNNVDMTKVVKLTITSKKMYLTVPTKSIINETAIYHKEPSTITTNIPAYIRCNWSISGIGSSVRNGAPKNGFNTAIVEVTPTNERFYVTVSVTPDYLGLAGTSTQFLVPEKSSNIRPMPDEPELAI